MTAAGQALRPSSPRVRPIEVASARGSTVSTGPSRTVKPVQPRPAPPVESDAELLARTAGGEEKAFRVLVERHISGLIGQARRTLQDAGEAEDIAQETFLRLWRLAPELEIEGAGLKPWLRRVAANLAIDRLRQTRRLVASDEPPEVPVGASQSAGLEEAELKARLAAALASLPERQATALRLFHIEGLSQATVAERMTISEEAVESLLARARRALKAALESDWRDLLPDQQD